MLSQIIFKVKANSFYIKILYGIISKKGWWIMSNFIVAFIASYVAITVFLIFGGYNILNNIFLLIGFISFVLAAFITASAKLFVKVEELEKRIDELEKTKED